MTDSFHELCFSLIFKRQFSAFINPPRGKASSDTPAEIAGVKDQIFNSYGALTPQETGSTQSITTPFPDASSRRSSTAATVS